MASLFLFFLYACEYQQTPVLLKDGTWRGVLMLDSLGIELPFNFEVKTKAGKKNLEIINSSERIAVDEITMNGDSLKIVLPVFDSEFSCRMYPDSLSGIWMNHARLNKNIIPFKAYFGQKNRFKKLKITESDFSGRWEARFSPGEDDEYTAIGEFTQQNGRVTGTFLTETGDYRYLEGVADANLLKVSAFDGAHAFLFHAVMNDDGTVDGSFWSGIHWQEKWVAMRNEKFHLRDPDSLTYLKKGYEKLEFSFPDLEGKKVSLSDKKYKDKVVIVQIMGSWCPNCMDETAFLSWFYDKYKSDGLEIIALAYEKIKDPEKARRNVARLKNHYVANYDFLIAGTSDRIEASRTLPMLNEILSYPTTIFIDRKGRIRKIHTGFSGPGTGQHYDFFVEKTTSFVQMLLKEP